MSIDETKVTILQAVKDENFFQVLAKVYVDEISSKAQNLAPALAELHNAALIDLNNQFLVLTGQNLKNELFILTKVYRKVVPMLISSVSDVLQCMSHLKAQSEAYATGLSLPDAFTEFCAVNIERSKEALELILADINKYGELLESVIVASEKTDPEWCFNQLIYLSEHENLDIKRLAFSSVGFMCLEQNPHIFDIYHLLDNGY